MYTIVLNIFFSILRFFRAILLFISQTPFLATCRIWNKQSPGFKNVNQIIITINTFSTKYSLLIIQTLQYFGETAQYFFSKDIKIVESTKNIGQLDMFKKLINHSSCFSSYQNITYFINPFWRGKCLLVVAMDGGI